MMITNNKIALCVLLFLLASDTFAYAQSPQDDSPKLINDELVLLFEAPAQMQIEEAFAAYQNNQFERNTKQQVSFGFTDQTIWAVLPVVNNSDTKQVNVLQIDNAWIDEIDLYYVYDGKVTGQNSIGDSLEFNQRTRSSRMPSASHEFPPGLSLVFFRFRSQDPMTIPIYLGTPDSFETKNLENAYFYGALYGSLLILLIYNLAIYFYLRENRYLLYSVYLLAFTAFNFTYSGHGFWLLWSNSIGLQQGLMPVLMFCYIIAGVMFTIEFLNTRVFLPSLYAARRKIYIGLCTLALVLLLVGSRSVAIMAQLVILTSLSFWMLLIGFTVWKNGNPAAKFFVPAIGLGTGGATISSLATWGVIPYSQWAFRGIEIGILLEMTLLSISLGFSFKLIQDARKSAETNARLDPLTNLFNRRAFSDLVRPIWEFGKRSKANMAIMLLDLDWFKKINDDFGHAVGDEVLERIAAELKGRLRASDIALRWGGEEFLIFLPDTELAEAKQLAEQLRKHIESVKVRNAIQVTMSIGVASECSTKTDLDSLIKKADDALYAAKHEGRNKVVVNNSTLKLSKA